MSRGNYVRGARYPYKPRDAVFLDERSTFDVFIDIPLGFLIDATLAEIEQNYDTEEKCLAKIEQLKWPNGFRCVCCNHTEYKLKSAGVKRCVRCRHQTTTKANTLFRSSKFPLPRWFVGIWHMTRPRTLITYGNLAKILNLSYASARSVHIRFYTYYRPKISIPNKNLK